MKIRKLLWIIVKIERECVFYELYLDYAFYSVVWRMEVFDLGN